MHWALYIFASAIRMTGNGKHLLLVLFRRSSFFIPFLLPIFTRTHSSLTSYPLLPQNPNVPRNEVPWVAPSGPQSSLVMSQPQWDVQTSPQTRHSNTAGLPLHPRVFNPMNAIRARSHGSCNIRGPLCPFSPLSHVCPPLPSSLIQAPARRA